jgi:hypothetical protein
MSYNPNSTSNRLAISGSTSGTLSMFASAVTSSYSITWPSAQSSSSGYVLTNDGAGNLSWAPGAGGSSVSSINSQTGAITITGSGGTTVTNVGTAFTITSSTGTVNVPTGGTGVTSFSALNQIVISGSTTTGALQQVPGGTAGYVLTSTGTASAPTWQAVASSSPYYVNTYTLSGTDITNGYVTLSSTPDTLSNTVLTVIGGPMQSYGSDYTVSGTQLTWIGNLATTIASGDKLVVQYD